MASRNRTLRLSLEAEEQYLARSFCPDSLPQNPRNLTICGDSFEALKKLPPQSIDLCIADPPYNLTKQYGDKVFARCDAEEYRDFTEKWLELVLPLLKPTASLYVCSDWKSSLIIGPLLADRIHLRSRITWGREKGRGTASNWKNSMEDIWFGTVSDSYTFHLDAVKIRRKVLATYRENGKPKDWKESGAERYRDTCPSNFWDDITVPFWSMPENTDHPAQKPEKLIAKLILASSTEGDLVLDPFMGSGTVCVTAKKLGRDYIGIEQDPGYCALAEKRLEEAEHSKRIQGLENGVFLERNAGAAGRISLDVNRD